MARALVRFNMSNFQALQVEDRGLPEARESKQREFTGNPRSIEGLRGNQAVHFLNTYRCATILSASIYCRCFAGGDEMPYITRRRHLRPHHSGALPRWCCHKDSSLTETSCCLDNYRLSHRYRRVQKDAPLVSSALGCLFWYAVLPGFHSGRVDCTV